MNAPHPANPRTANSKHQGTGLAHVLAGLWRDVSLALWLAGNP